MKDIDTILEPVKSKEALALLTSMPDQTISTNFEFLRPHVSHLADLAGLAEKYWPDDISASLIKLRIFGEFLVKEIYAKNGFEMYSSDSFMDLLEANEFTSYAPSVVLDKFHILRTKGNDAAHNAKIQFEKIDGLMCLKQAHDLAKWYLVAQGIQLPADAVVWKSVPETDATEELAKKNKKLTKQLEENGAVMQELLEEQAAARKKIEALESQKIEQVKTEATTSAQKAADALSFDEATTRKLLIDTQLAEAGWDVGRNGKDTLTVKQEVKVSDQETPTGIGYVDYVLYSEDGKPLGLVEAKRTSVSESKGKKQAEVYADALEKETGTRPVIYYTNGYRIKMWNDGRGQAIRNVYGYYSPDSLKYEHFLASNASDLSTVAADPAIAGRPYQMESIKRVATKFDTDRKRKALIIQATGTGKTRVAISISELLIRAKWAKRILFLCDRKELRKQAKDAFEDFLPGEPRCVIKKGNISTNDRIYLATYPSMMGCFQSYDVGFFDLIIADESHRSIYNRYQDIFKWFDGYKLGLTATPVQFLERNTFGFFGCDDEDPTAQYTYQQAIDHNPPFLAEFNVIAVTTKFQREGIKWGELTLEQQEQLREEEAIDDPEGTAIEPGDIGTKFYVDSTDRAILRNLMDNGIKNANKTHVGKSIVFARNQKHAEKLVELFDDMYPQYGSKLCAVITSNVERAETLITNFKNPAHDLHIAVSVDMLDTGIDVPEIVNLVFAKPVKSVAKFWQMIGRGTRLRENLFGPGKHKTHFQIFDHFGNFAYFKMMEKEKQPTQDKALLEKLFEARIQLGEESLKAQDLPSLQLANKLLKADLNSLPDRSISIIDNKQMIDTVSANNDLFGATTIIQLKKIARLMQEVSVRGQEIAYEFDVNLTRLQIARIQKSSKVENVIGKIVSDVSLLPINLPQVAVKNKYIQLAKDTNYLANCSITELDTLRLELRSIMKHRQKTGGGGVEGLDTLGTIEDSDLQSDQVTVSFVSEPYPAYRQRVHGVLQDIIETDPVIAKLRDGQGITEDELIELANNVATKDPTIRIQDLKKYPDIKDNIAKALIGIVGLKPEKVADFFSTFLQSHPNLNANQMTFLDIVQQKIATYGPIQPKELFDISPPGMGNTSFDVTFPEDDQEAIISIIRTIDEEVA